jgi:hypothetical protein
MSCRGDPLGDVGASFAPSVHREGPRLLGGLRAHMREAQGQGAGADRYEVRTRSQE